MNVKNSMDHVGNSAGGGMLSLFSYRQRRRESCV